MKAIDLFAGCGGFTLGAQAAGVDVAWAANHWEFAVKTHAANHPSTAHVCQDLRQADWTALPSYDLLLAAPACQGHSSASQPKRRQFHDALRATAFAVVDCADVTNPEAIIVENVPDFRRWRLYRLWREMLQELGYHVTDEILRASHFGVPQRRDRLFVIATRKPYYRLAPPTPVEPAFGPCIEWNAGRWRPVSKASANAQRRIAAAQKRYGAQCLSQHVTGHPGVPLDEPIRTVTTKDQWCVVDGDHYRPLTLREYARAMGFPDDYKWPAGTRRSDALRGLGNAVPPPLAAGVIRSVLDAA